MRNRMKKAAITTALTLTLLVPGLASADDMMKPMTSDMDGMKSEMSMGMGNGMKSDMSMDMGKEAMTDKSMGMEQGMAMGTGDNTDMMMMGDMAYVPLRLLAETLGYKVSWNADDMSIMLTFMGMAMDNQAGKSMNDMSMKEMYTIKLMPGSKQITVGMDMKQLDASPVLMDGKTYVTKSFVTTYLLKPFMMNAM